MIKNFAHSLSFKAALSGKWIVLALAFIFVHGCGKVAEVSEAGAVQGASGPLKLVAAELTMVSLGVPYKEIIKIEGGIGPYAVNVVSGKLLEGLKLDATTGIISGTVDKSQTGVTESLAVKVTDAAGNTADQSYTLKASDYTFEITPESVPTVTPTIGFSMQLGAVGAEAPLTYSVSGNLPLNFEISESGTIRTTGIHVPASSANTNWPIVVTGKDKNGVSAQRSLTIAVGAAPVITDLNVVTSTLPTMTAGGSYIGVVGVTGGKPPYTYAVSFGSLPSGLSLSSTTGELSGTLPHSLRGSSYTFQITVQDSVNNTDVQGFSGTINTYSTTILPATLSAATPGANYSATITTIGGQSAYSYTITSGTLPSGLSLSSSGDITGSVAESEAGNAPSITVRSTDANGVFNTATYSLAVSSFAVSVTTTTLNNAVESTAYTNSGTALAATGGTSPYTYEYTGTLPSGVGLTSSGTFFGTPSSGSGALAGGTSYTIQVRARDAINRVSARQALTLTVTVSAPVVTAGSLTNAVLGNAYNVTLAASGGRSPYSYALASGSLPTGLSLSAGGVISGTATSAATCPASQFGIQVTDALSQVSASSLKCITTVSGVTITTSTLAAIVTGQSYSATLAASGGSTPYTFSVSGLPSGISLNSSTGALSGFVNDPVGSYTVYFTVTDSSSPPVSQTRSYTMAVIDPVTITTSTLVRGATGKVYGPVTLTSSGGTSPITFAVTSGSLPSGLSMSSAGVISGTPANSAAGNNYGVHNFNVVATDANGKTSTAASLTINITAAPKIANTSLPPAVLSTPYAVDLKRTGGANPFINSTNIAFANYVGSHRFTFGSQFKYNYGSHFRYSNIDGGFTVYRQCYRNGCLWFSRYQSPESKSTFCR